MATVEEQEYLQKAYDLLDDARAFVEDAEWLAHERDDGRSDEILNLLTDLNNVTDDLENLL